MKLVRGGKGSSQSHVWENCKILKTANKTSSEDGKGEFGGWKRVDTCKTGTIGDDCAPERHRAFSQIQSEVETPHLVEVGRSPTRAAIPLSPCCLGEPTSPLRLPVRERESKEPNNRLAPWRESERDEKGNRDWIN